MYDLVRNLPVAKFYYQGSHSHPVRRTVLVVENGRNTLKGYELREGAETRSFAMAPIKAFSKNRIAKIGQCGRRLRTRTPAKMHKKSTFERLSLLDLVKTGV